MLFVLDGEKLWSKKIGTANKACADCHGDATETMKGVAARYPAFDKTLGRPVNLGAAHQSLPRQSPAGLATGL